MRQFSLSTEQSMSHDHTHPGPCKPCNHAHHEEAKSSSHTHSHHEQAKPSSHTHSHHEQAKLSSHTHSHHEQAKLSSHAHSAQTKPHAPLQATEPGTTLAHIRIGQMDCPIEEALLRKKLGTLKAVQQLHFDLMQRVLHIVYLEGALEEILAAIRTLAMTPEVLTAETPAAPLNLPPSHWPLSLIVGGVFAMLAELSHFAFASSNISALLAIAALFTCGLTTYRRGWIAIRNGNLNINALMSLAVTGAAAIGQWPEAAMVMFLFNVAEHIEARSLDRARYATQRLLALTPSTATQKQADGRWKTVAAADLRINDVVQVRPGERIAADGIILAGYSSVDQSAITGESLPLEKKPGDKVYAGTVNASGAFEYQVTASAQDTTLARIIHTVEQATATRAPIQRFIDRFSRLYTPIMVGMAVLTACIPPLIWHAPWTEAVYRALALLIIACPCALVISTPVSIVSALTAASRRGILIKGGVYLENGRKLRWLALDKTGTLTHGKPVLTDLVIPSSHPTQGLTSPTPAELVASLAGRSDHPVSQALAANQAQEKQYPIQDFQALPGRGIMGYLDGQPYYLGNRRLIQELELSSSTLTQQLDAWEAQGKTTVILSHDKAVLALAAVADTVRAESREAIDRLHALGVKLSILSGDNTTTVQAIANQLGIRHACGEQLPEQKLSALESYMGPGLVGMVGDGINDAPALARADIGFAMGAAGTDTAIETADVALMDDDLGKISEFIQLSHMTHRVLVQNIVLALVIKGVFLTLALGGFATLWMAVFADVGASLLVVANGLRLLKAGDGRLAIPRPIP